MSTEMPGMERENLTSAEVVQALTTEYSDVYGMNLHTGEVIIYRFTGRAIGVKEQLCLDQGYAGAMEAYIKNNVLEDDHEMMKQMTEESKLVEELRQNAVYKVHYRVLRKGELHYYYMKAVRVGEADSFSHVILGFANEDAEIRRKDAAPFSQETKLNSRRKLLLIEDDAKTREFLKKTMEKRFEILETDDGLTGYELLQKYYRELSAVILDIKAPRMDGETFIRKAKADILLSTVPLIISTYMESEQQEIDYLNMGATDFILRPYHPDIILRRIESAVRLKESTAALNAIEFDSLTGLYTLNAFYHHAETMLKSNPDVKFNMVISDIMNFKRINERYGRNMGDAILKEIGKTLREGSANFELCGRYGSDQFVTLFRDNGEYDFNAMVFEKNQELPVKNMVVKFGVYENVEHDLPVSVICDRILVALKTIKHQYEKIFVKYDDELKKRVEQQNQIEENMERALIEHQFQIYYQPKYDLHMDRTAGAEALVRWIHPQFGFMNPGMFIPLFEKNGFIKRLDWYVWEESCKNLAEWKKTGKKVVPISVNVSRRDFEQENLAERIIKMVDHYELDHSLFHVEVTETSYSYNPKQVTENIGKLHESGFVIELDDFGTGYSSLTSLSSMPIDVLKLDMSLIKEYDPASERNVLEFAMELAKIMKLKIVQEGVETEEQMKRVKDLGCDFIQGYYYSKPLQKDDFEKYLEQENA